MLIDLPDLVDIAVQQGDTLQLILELEDEHHSPMNLSGHSVELSVSRDRRANPAWSWTDTPQFADITDANAGEITIGLTPAATRAFGQLETLPFSVVLISPSSARTTILTGNIRLRLEAKAAAP